MADLAGADHYAVLGVSRDASPAEIRRAFRRLAKAFHPDRRPDSPGDAEKFGQVGKSYDILSDPTRRREYDRLTQAAKFKTPKQKHADRKPPPPPPPVALAFQVRVQDLTALADTSATVPATGITFSFDWGDGSPATSSPTHTYATPSPYLVKVSAQDTLGRIEVASKSIQAREPKPVLEVRPIANLLDIFLDTAATSSVTTPTFSFNWGDGSPPTMTPRHSYPCAGIYDVTVSATNTTASVATTISISVLEPAPDVKIEAHSEGRSVRVDPSGTLPRKGVRFSVDWDDGSPLDTSLTHIYGTEGTFSVRVSGVNTAGVGIVIQTVSVVDPPVISITTRQDELTVSIDTGRTTSSAPATFSFTWGDGSKVSPEATHTFRNPGTYDVRVTATNKGGSSTRIQTVTVSRKPVIDGLGFANVDLRAKVASRSIASDTDLIVLYDWGDGSPQSLAGIHNYKRSGTYVVTVSAYNQEGETSRGFDITVRGVLENRLRYLGRWLFNIARSALGTLTSSRTSREQRSKRTRRVDPFAAAMLVATVALLAAIGSFRVYLGKQPTNAKLSAPTSAASSTSATTSSQARTPATADKTTATARSRRGRVTVPAVIDSLADESVATALRVSVGDKITLKATGSTRYGDDGDAACSGAPVVDATGRRSIQGRPCKPKYDLGAPVPGAPVGSVIARIGSSDWFSAIPGRAIVAPAAGALALGYNDPYSADNRGSYAVTVVVVDG